MLGYLRFSLLILSTLLFHTACGGDGASDGDCGDAIVDSGEDCDDGNSVSGDGCSLDCELEVEGICGDGVTNIGEQCDDGNTVSSDGCSATCDEEAVEVVCEELPALESGTCEVTAGDGRTALLGDVLAPNSIYRGGAVVVDESGVISCVGCDCDTSSATIVSCPQGVISPGLINSHDHITFAQNDPYTDTGERYEHRHDWRKGLRGHTKISSQGSASGDQMKWAELRFLMGGTTSTIGSGSTDGFLRNLDRSAQEGLGQPQVEYDTFPLGDSDGDLEDASCSYPSPATMAEIANEEAYFPHIAEGIDDEANNEFVCTSSNDNGANDLLEMQSAFIHGVGLRAVEFETMAAAQTKLIWSPRSNITLYGETARVALADRLGVTIALGTDWIPTGSMNMQRELACADQFNRDNLGDYFSDADLWRMVTENGAVASATNDVIGTLAMGKVADIAIYDGAANPDYRAVIDAAAQDTVMVMRGGEVLYGEASVVNVLGSGNCDTIDVCGQDRVLCAEDDIGKNYADLKSSNTGIYPDFFCGLPSNEPSCVPERPESVEMGSVYTGVPSPEDSDGDGIVDSSDLCPTIFNPIQPMDHGVQADADDDGQGDSCDPCPLDPNTTVCTVFDPSDADGDGVSANEDNCPSVANPNQEDSDSDNKGDACDECPNFANQAPLACPATIYDIKTGVASGTVSVSDVLVTACVDGTGFFVQTVAGDTAFDGVQNSGLFVYYPAATCGGNLSRGDRVDISPSGTVQDFFGQVQLSNVGVSVPSSGNALPTPELLTAGQAGGTVSNEYEGVLVRVENVSVTDIAPPPGDGDTAPTNEFEVDSALRVDDLLYATPFPSLGAGYNSIAGVLSYRYQLQVLLPRDAGDIVLGDPTLVGFGPSLSFVNANESAVATGPMPLTVQLSHAATLDTFVSISSADSASLSVVGNGVTVLAGQDSAVVLVDGLTQANAVSLTASLDVSNLMAEVRVVGAAEVPVLSAISGGTLSPGNDTTLTLSLDIPARVGDEIVSLATAPGMAGSVPASVTVLAGELEASFLFSATAPGTETVTATLGASMASATVEVIDGELVINEVDYDQVDDDTNEFVEIFNGSTVTQSLSNLSLVFINGATSDEYLRVDLDSAVDLAPGEYLVVGSTTLLATVPSSAKTIAFAAADNSVQNGGPDAVGLYDRGADEMIDVLSYEGSETAGTVNGGTTFDFVEGTALLAADGNDTAGSLCRIPNGTDTNDADSDWALSASTTPGASNLP